MIIEWCTIRVNDMETSKDFYKNFLGMKEMRSFLADEDTEISFLSDENGAQIELIYNKKDCQKKECNLVTLGMRVSNYEELLEKSTQADMITAGPMILGKDMHCFFINDPNGVGIQIIRG